MARERLLLCCFANRVVRYMLLQVLVVVLALVVCFSARELVNVVTPADAASLCQQNDSRNHRDGFGVFGAMIALSSRLYDPVISHHDPSPFFIPS